jgi:hypothetical protein
VEANPHPCPSQAGLLPSLLFHASCPFIFLSPFVGSTPKHTDTVAAAVPSPASILLPLPFHMPPFTYSLTNPAAVAAVGASSEVVAVVRKPLVARRGGGAAQAAGGGGAALCRVCVEETIRLITSRKLLCLFSISYVPPPPPPPPHKHAHHPTHAHPRTGARASRAAPRSRPATSPGCRPPRRRRRAPPSACAGTRG